MIDEFELIDFDGRDMTLRIVCSKGTYIRALARDLGKALGSGAHLISLRRTAVGPVRAEKCMSVDEAVRMIGTATLELPEEWLKEHPLPTPQPHELTSEL